MGSSQSRSESKSNSKIQCSGITKINQEFVGEDICDSEVVKKIYYVMAPLNDSFLLSFLVQQAFHVGLVIESESGFFYALQVTALKDKTVIHFTKRDSFYIAKLAMKDMNAENIECFDVEECQPLYRSKTKIKNGRTFKEIKNFCSNYLIKNPDYNLFTRNCKDFACEFLEEFTENSNIRYTDNWAHIPILGKFVMSSIKFGATLRTTSEFLPATFKAHKSLANRSHTCRLW